MNEQPPNQNDPSEEKERIGKLFDSWQEELGSSLEGRAELIRRQAKFYIENGYEDDAISTLEDGMEMAYQENNRALYEEFEELLNNITQ